VVNYLEDHPEFINNGEDVKKPQALRRFDEQKYKMLNSELKYLYTALTRARCNLWIYDSNDEKRSPMFYYFRKRGLVRVLSTSITAGQSDDSVMNSGNIFANKSSKEEWKQEGDRYKGKNNWDLAILCYMKAEMKDLVKEAQAYRYMSNGTKSRNKRDIKEMKDHFIRAALSFFRCFKIHPRVKWIEKAAVCLFNASAYDLAAKLFIKIMKVRVATVPLSHICVLV